MNAVGGSSRSYWYELGREKSKFGRGLGGDRHRSCKRNLFVQYWDMPTTSTRVTVVWRGNPEVSSSESERDVRYPTIMAALTEVGFEVRSLGYLDSERDQAREALQGSSAVLVWADPIGADGNRDQLDDMLREVARDGTLVYTNPDTILKMGTKDVLFDTRYLSWSSDVQRYSTYRDFVELFPVVLKESAGRVLKQHRGNGGIGIWKVELLEADAPRDGSAEQVVRVQHAAPRDDSSEVLALSKFFERMQPYFAGSGHLIDQAFVPRITNGMVRAYLIKKNVVGFARQFAPPRSDGAGSGAEQRVFGIPGAKTMLPANANEFGELKRILEESWVSEMQAILKITDDELPLLWDADFLFGPKNDAGVDTFVLCEINVSCVSPFPESVPGLLATTLRSALAT